MVLARSAIAAWDVSVEGYWERMASMKVGAGRGRSIGSIFGVEMLGCEMLTRHCFIWQRVGCGGVQVWELDDTQITKC